MLLGALITPGANEHPPAAKSHVREADGTDRLGHGDAREARDERPENQSCAAAMPP
jgi:hypothetical protein